VYHHAALFFGGDQVERVVPNALAWARVIGLGISRSTLIFVRCLSELFKTDA
jgi:hypothetical protein